MHWEQFLCLRTETSTSGAAPAGEDLPLEALCTHPRAAGMLQRAEDGFMLVFCHTEGINKSYCPQGAFHVCIYTVSLALGSLVWWLATLHIAGGWNKMTSVPFQPSPLYGSNMLDRSYRNLTFLLGCWHPEAFLQKLRTAICFMQAMRNKDWHTFQLLEFSFRTVIQRATVNTVPP